MRSKTLRSVLAVTVLTVGLAGCSSGANPQDVHAEAPTFSGGSTTEAAPTSNPSAVTSPAGGSVTSKNRLFNFVVPPGWNLTNNDKAEAYLSSATVSHDVAPTIVVTKSSTTPVPALDEVLQMSMMQDRQAGNSDTTMPQRQVGGEQALGFRSTSTVKSVPITRTYTIVAHNGQLFTIVLTSATATQSDSESVLNSLLASWSWTKAGDASSTANGTTPAAIPTSTSTSASPSPSSGASSSGAPSATPSAAATSAPAAQSTSASKAPAPKASASKK